MIVFQASKRQFVRDTFQDDIEAVLAQEFLRSTGHQPSPSEFNAWKHSLFEVGEVLKDPGIPDDMGVAVEFSFLQAILETAVVRPRPIDLSHRAEVKSTAFHQCDSEEVF